MPGTLKHDRAARPRPDAGARPYYIGGYMSPAVYYRWVAIIEAEEKRLGVKITNTQAMGMLIAQHPAPPSVDERARELMGKETTDGQT